MTVIAMSEAELDRMSVLRDLAADRIRVSEASTLLVARFWPLQAAARTLSNSRPFKMRLVGAAILPPGPAPAYDPVRCNRLMGHLAKECWERQSRLRSFAPRDGFRPRCREGPLLGQEPT